MENILRLKKKILTILLVGFALLFIMLLFQSLNDKYKHLIYIPWIWLMAIYLPPITLAFLAKNQTKKINEKPLIILCSLLVVASIFTIIFQGIAKLNNPEVETYIVFVGTLKRSLFFLLPLEGFLLFIIWKSMIQKGPEPPKKDPKVFISYNHNDKEIALQIKEAIEAVDIPVIIDVVDMVPGTPINKFIQKSIKEATVVVSIVSNLSLNSAWVAKETTDTFFLESYSDNIKFIACYLDDDFFQDDYSLRTAKNIQTRINEVQSLIEQSHDEKLDTRNLNSHKSRLILLRNNLDGIIQRLNDNLSLDFRKDKIDQNLKKLLQAIQSQNN